MLYDEIHKAVATALDSLGRQKFALEKEQVKAAEAEAFGKRAQLITANLYRIKPGMKTVTVDDWDQDGAEVELRFDTARYASAKDEAEALFKKARKCRRGAKQIAELLEQVHWAIGCREGQVLQSLPCRNVCCGTAQWGIARIPSPLFVSLPPHHHPSRVPFLRRCTVCAAVFWSARTKGDAFGAAKGPSV